MANSTRLVGQQQLPWLSEVRELAVVERDCSLGNKSHDVQSLVKRLLSRPQQVDHDLYKLMPSLCCLPFASALCCKAAKHSFGCAAPWVQTILPLVVVRWAALKLLVASCTSSSADPYHLAQFFVRTCSL